MGIIELGSILSACILIIGTCWKTFAMCHKMLAKLEDFEETQKRNEMHIVKLGLFNEVLVTRAGATVSTHCGPNTIGVLFARK